MKARRLGGGEQAAWTIQLHQNAAAELLTLPIEMQRRFARAFEALEVDPLRPRPGCDLRKLADVRPGSLYRLRVGDGRACYILVSDDRTIRVMVVDYRGKGYDRMIATAISRSASLSGGTLR